jgi:YVTN family beta-propeller protein
MRSLRFVLLFATIAISVASPAQQYKVTNSISSAGEGGWDYSFADSIARKLYVTHGSEVLVIDLDSEKSVGKITGLNRIHGVAIADDLHRGFISDGAANEVVVFDTSTNSEIQKVKAGTNPDGIVFDPFSKRVFAFNGRSQDATVIDAATGKVAGTIGLGGKPEFPVSDGKGNLYVNIEDKSEIARINPASMQVEARWPLAPCEEPSGLAMDTANRRLFAVCSNQKMAVVNADTGKVVATVAIGNGPDATSFDAGKGLVFSSNGQDGTITVVKQESPDKYSVLETVPTEKSARTMTLDSKTHRLFLSAAKLGPPPAATAANPHPWPKVVPDSFHVLVVSPL